MTTSTTTRFGGSGRTGTAPDETARATGGRRPARIAGLDGIRALAITAVLVFHLNAAWLPGGFLGVDVFFVVSGFLITSLLVDEHQRTGTIALRQFWVRRARRLLPALILCVVVSVLIARVVSGELLVAIGRQVLGALTFSTNWIEITAGSSYFEQTAPQLFLNLWSLAVEEQFYLVWPLVTLLLVRVASERVRVGTALAIGFSSAALMALLFSPDADATRVYYGTDTHVMGLMVGAALAFAWASPRLARRLAPSSWGRGGRFAVPAGAAVLGAGLLLLDEAHAATFRGGILLASLATGILVLGLLDRGLLGASGRATTWQRLTAHPVATWVGQRSYSLYLWHWPVILIVSIDNPSVPGTGGHLISRVWCVIVTFALADLSYRFVETPFRREGFRVVGRRLLAWVTAGSRRSRQVVAAAVVVTAVSTGVVLATAPAKSETALLLEANASAAGDTVDPVARATTTTRPAPRSTAGAAPSSRPAHPPAASTAAPPASPSSAPSSAAPAGKAPTAPVARVAPEAAKASFTMPAGNEIDAYGDSIMVGSLGAIRYYFPGIRIDAKSNRRWADGLAQVRSRADNRRAVVLAFGTNWGVDADQVRATLDALGPDRMVVLITIMGPMARIDRDNATLAEIAAERPNVAVADWASAVRAEPDQLQSDRIHPSLTGAHLFAKTIRQALADLSERHTGQKVALKELPRP